MTSIINSQWPAVLESHRALSVCVYTHRNTVCILHLWTGAIFLVLVSNTPSAQLRLNLCDSTLVINNVASSDHTTDGQCQITVWSPKKTASLCPVLYLRATCSNGDRADVCYTFVIYDCLIYQCSVRMSLRVHQRIVLSFAQLVVMRILGAPSDKELTFPEYQEGDDPFEVITEEDLLLADQELNRELLRYAGWTLFSVVLFLILVYCAVTDPRAFIVAFGTGMPCCLMFPCIKSLYKFTNPYKIIQASVNKYVPGILQNDDGTLKTYEPSDEEIASLYELINEVVSL
ncbi:hypothetical protein PoB_004732000 [Plakobranchus ocellatus]|uniref:Uncharacterized protein n=1 Tax=Plakobranchus ocellatus TaxID=259542 RepID=A0AAV4BJV7_9GAST|nr:hypothetical protein PoB_004732000 [Plakobranchus ocellatus]